MALPFLTFELVQLLTRVLKEVKKRVTRTIQLWVFLCLSLANLSIKSHIVSKHLDLQTVIFNFVIPLRPLLECFTCLSIEFLFI
ncbi:hypothetical protein HanXRQr2_Chr12g0535101 [Helianthus annuus]|uniref:Uncharacterized protein n=1 Tax=Helianthus annuus TaxID=4232 RepID=A0A9K3MVD8_HELAN|nr:hypothetical protein HanXRQr2_Chr12g0535101 [Helianthus annuus]KAJ0492578.1 hypothetical protein HanIR_Chr12g0576461 [Helianthus annuus]KAJ0862206.1 hypothetical protein HanPSC8_Chr12g0515421 [Helianthus annuus]